MHAHILIFSKDFREPLSRFLELSCCVVLSSLELCPATFSCLGLPEPQPSFPQLSETAMVCWGHLLPPPSFPWPAVCSQGDLRAHVICLCPVRNHSSVLPAVQCLQTVVPCVLFSFLVHSKKVHVVSITPSETAAVCWLILSGAVTLSLTSFHPECQVLLLLHFILNVRSWYYSHYSPRGGNRGSERLKSMPTVTQLLILELMHLPLYQCLSKNIC